ncbi:MAG: PVC-type heme-binding CxxCH protein [Adhaeribacter sp.]
MRHIPFPKPGAGKFIGFIALLGAVLWIGGWKKAEPASDGLEAYKVPEGFRVEQAVAPGLLSYPMFATLDNQGRLFVIESSGKTTSTEEVLKNPTFQVRLLEDKDADGLFEKATVYADKIPYPMGGTFYRGSFYVTAAPDLLRFTDTDGDGVADKRDTILSGWVLHHNAATLSGPFFGPDGWMYMCDARRGFDIQTKEGTRLKGKGARIWRCRPDGTGLEAMSGGGLDNTIELIFMPAGETIGTMTYFTDPRDGLRDALLHWVEGGVYPKPHPVIQDDGLKLTGDLMPVMTKLPRVSHSGLMRYRSAGFGASYQGNLFSAQFNTGRIMRHLISPQGASFRTVEEPFLTSDNPDTHLTDVLEDADGSLLVVNTGGWFIAGCPLSVVAKTDVKGGIFRVRKTGAPPVADPWGRQLNLETLAPQKLVSYLQDPRPAVRDQAAEHLVAAGQAAVAPLRQALQSGGGEQLRTSAVFALYRIHTPAALAGLRAALNDKSAGVRTAAARVLGLAKDRPALDKLMALVQHDQAPVRRQAATALGQIGDARAIPALLAAAARPADRFVEHAIIYSLITLNSSAPLVAALDHAQAPVRKAALIALDQMEGAPLRRQHLAPFLASRDAGLRQAGIWVAGHHPAWTDVVIDFLEARLDKDVPGADQESVQELLLTFCGDAQVQQFVAAQLNSAAPAARKLLFLDVVNRCSLKELPREWVAVLGRLLQQNNTPVRAQVLEVIAARGIPALDAELEKIIRNPQALPALQLQALGARLRSQPQLSEAEFNLLLSYLGPEQEVPLRQSAVRLLAQAEVSEPQLLSLAQQQLARADPFLLPGLVQAFEGSRSEAVGKALVAALQASADRLDHLSLPELQKLLTYFPGPVEEEAGVLVKTLQQKQAGRLAELQHLEARLQRGDVGEGRKLFYSKANCATCHAVVGKGGLFGPDLSNIGEIRSRHDILEAILYPSASFAREYETARIVTRNNTYTGVVKEQLPEVLVVETGPGLRMRIPRADIRAIEPQNVSLMPPGLHKQLNSREMSDLMAYLTSLPDGLGQIRKTH